MLDTVLESTRASTPASAKETAETTIIHVEVEAGHSGPIETGPAEATQSIEQEPSDVALVLEKKTRPRRLNLLLLKRLLKS